VTARIRKEIPMGDGQGMSTTKKALIGAGILAAAGVLAYSLLSEEPPIRVKGGGLDVVLGGDATWEDGGDDWKVKSGGWNLSGVYYFGIDVGKSCGNSGPPPAKVKRLTLVYGGGTYTIRRHTTALFKTKLEPKGDFSLTDPKKKTLSNAKSSALTVTAKPDGGGQDWTCVFEAEQFEELCLDHKQPCM
jgi:hypothetical protein